MYNFIPVHPIKICADVMLSPRSITLFLATILRPLSKIPENRGTLNSVPVQAQGISSLTTSTSPVWL